MFVSPSQRAQGLILWRVWGRSPDINGDPIRTDSGVNNVTPLPSTGLGIGTKFFSLLPSSATLFDTLSLISNYSSTRILLYYVSLLDLSWKQVGVSTLKFSPIILKFIRRFRILFAFICLGFIFFLHLSKDFGHLFVLVSLLNYGKISNFYLYI